MGNIIIGNDKIIERLNEIKLILEPLKKVSINSQRYRYSVEGGIALGAHSGQSDDTRYDNWVFPTFAKDISGQYYEVWKPEKGGRTLFLERAYLNLLKANRVNHCNEKFVCIHCDPNFTGNLYKIGPHLHIKQAEDPIPECHFPFNQGHISDVLGSVETLTSAIKSSVKIVADEVVSRMANIA